MKQDFSDLTNSASEIVNSVTTSGVLLGVLKDKCRDTGAQFIDNDQNFLFAMDLETRQPSRMTVSIFLLGD